MNSDQGTEAAPERWPVHRWWGLVGLVLATQLVLIFWLGDQGPVRSIPKSVPLSLHAVGTVSSELLALNDPTLFALPHGESFSGPAWLTIPSLGAEPFQWSEPPEWLGLAVDQLGGVFHNFLATNQIIAPEALARLEPELSFPTASAAQPVTYRSTYEVFGGLTKDSLVAPLMVSSWTNAEFLTNTIVQLLVNSAGTPVSVTLLCNSGSAEADQFALLQAESARFQALPGSEPNPSGSPGRLRWCQIVFDWQTVPLSATAAPTGGS